MRLLSLKKAVPPKAKHPWLLSLGFSFLLTPLGVGLHVKPSAALPPPKANAAVIWVAGAFWSRPLRAGSGKWIQTDQRSAMQLCREWGGSLPTSEALQELAARLNDRGENPDPSLNELARLSPALVWLHEQENLNDYWASAYHLTQRFRDDRRYWDDELSVVCVRRPS